MKTGASAGAPYGLEALETEPSSRAALPNSVESDRSVRPALNASVGSLRGPAERRQGLARSRSRIGYLHSGY